MIDVNSLQSEDRKNTGRRAYDSENNLTSDYIQGEFNTIRDKVSRIEQKIFNGFDSKITSTALAVEDVRRDVRGLHRLIVGMLLSTIGAAVSVILVLVLGG